MNNYNFCKTPDYFKQIEKILQIPFEIKHFSLLEKQYHDFHDSFHKDQLINCKIKRESILPMSTDDPFIKAFNKDNEYVIGIDLPALISVPNSVGTIFILGEDPLRNHVINENADTKDIYLATPYGIHLDKCKKGRQKIYWEISEIIFKLGYNIYYTDINKIWIKSNKANSKKLLIPCDLNGKFIDCLVEEIKIFDPKLVISFGNQAKDAINNINIPEIKKLNLIHPTFSARSHWKKELNASATNSAILNYIDSKINIIMK